MTMNRDRTFSTYCSSQALLNIELWSKQKCRSTVSDLAMLFTKYLLRWAFKEVRGFVLPIFYHFFTLKPQTLILHVKKKAHAPISVCNVSNGLWFSARLIKYVRIWGSWDLSIYNCSNLKHSGPCRITSWQLPSKANAVFNLIFLIQSKPQRANKTYLYNKSRNFNSS